MHSIDKGRPVDTATIQLMQDRTAELHDIQQTVPAQELFDLLTSHRAALTALRTNTQTDATRNPLGVMMGETELGSLTMSTYMALDHPDTTAAADSLLASLSPQTTRPAQSHSLTSPLTLSG
jgi:hypothetical protein